MIRSLTLVIMLLVAHDSAAQQGTDVLAEHRMQFGELVERTIGSAAQPVVFDWRKTRLQVAATAGYPLDMSSFGTARAGILLRRPMGGALLELGIGAVSTWDTATTRALSTTAYRQFARPSRVIADLSVAVPIAEGVATSRVRWLPAAHLSLNLYGSLRYRYYPGSLSNLSAVDALGAVFAPRLSESELANVSGLRSDGMQVDPGRYDLMMGIGNDLYLKQGFFISPRVLIAVPVLAPLTETQLKVWVDLAVHVGWAF